MTTTNQNIIEDSNWYTITQNKLYIPHTQSKTLIPFSFNERQKKATKLIEENCSPIRILKYGRQEGITTLLAAFIATNAYLSKNKFIFFTAYKDMAIQPFDLINRFFIQLNVKFSANKQNKLIKLDNGSEILFATDSYKIRGHRADYIIIDEIQFIKEIDILRTLSLNLNENGKLIYSVY